MARTPETGLLYIPLDIDFFKDAKVRKIEQEHGIIAELVIIHLLRCIYKSSYYIKLDDDVLFLVASHVKKDELFVSQIIEKALEVDFFSWKMYNNYNILTSKDIQNRYLQVVKANRIKRPSIDEKYKLYRQEHECGINVQQCTTNVHKCTMSVHECSINVQELGINAQKHGINAHLLPKNVHLSPNTCMYVSKYNNNLSNNKKTYIHTYGKDEFFFNLFEEWWKKFDNSPYYDSYQRCKAEWSKLTDDEATDCLATVDEYIQEYPDKEHRHNPLNYLRLKMWLPENKPKNPKNRRTKNERNTCLQAGTGKFESRAGRNGNNYGRNDRKNTRPFAKRSSDNRAIADDPTYGKIL